MFLPGARGGRKLGDPEVDLRRSCPRGRANEVSIKGFSFDMSSQSDSGWLLLSDAVDRLSAAHNVREDQAKLDICAAIAELKLRIRVHVSDGHARQIAEINDIAIPDKLTPDRIEWALSRPALLHPWRTQSADGWQERRLTLIEACVEDFTTELCRDISSVPLPHRQSIPAQLVTYPDRLQYARELARAEWSPCPGTIDELSCLVGNNARTIP